MNKPVVVFSVGLITGLVVVPYVLLGPVRFGMYKNTLLNAVTP